MGIVDTFSQISFFVCRKKKLPCDERRTREQQGLAKHPLAWLGWLACRGLPWIGLAWACLAYLALAWSSNNNNNNNNLYHGWFVSFREGFHTAVRTYPYIRRGIFHNTWEFSLPQSSRPLTSAILHFMEPTAYRATPTKWHRPQVVRSTTEDVPPGAAAPSGTLNRG